jgi:hypothetical protein
MIRDPTQEGKRINKTKITKIMQIHQINKEKETRAEKGMTTRKMIKTNHQKFTWKKHILMRSTFLYAIRIKI